jgi:hypothetical protein
MENDKRQGQVKTKEVMVWMFHASWIFCDLSNDHFYNIDSISVKNAGEVKSRGG